MSTVQKIQEVAPEVLEKLRTIDACTLSNCIERLNIRLRNEGFADHSVRCLSPRLGPMVGYAVPGRMRSSEAPTTRHWYYRSMDWWSYVLTIPAPRVIVMQDVDARPGLGALFGEVHANICRALDCIGYVTNGTVRDLPGLEQTGLHLFASGLAVSHAYAHVIDFGEPVEVGGMTVHPGDLLHGDLHGVQCVPAVAAAELPAIAAELMTEEHELIWLCRSSEFSLQKLNAYIERVGRT